MMKEAGFVLLRKEEIFCRILELVPYGLERMAKKHTT